MEKSGILPRSQLNLIELLLQTNNARLTEDGKIIQCLYCGSTVKKIEEAVKSVTK
jgi:hypothetical protein